MQIPPELEGGTYANFLGVWHTPYEFTLDFAVMQPRQETEDGLRIPCRVVSRVRLPVTLMFEVLRTLNANMTRYESTFGEIKEPEDDGGQTSG
ncbi:MAG: DUF3467 domain-containing protein [Actinomycetota bacterium]